MGAGEQVEFDVMMGVISSLSRRDFLVFRTNELPVYCYEEFDPRWYGWGSFLLSSRRFESIVVPIIGRRLFSNVCGMFRPHDVTWLGLEIVALSDCCCERNCV